MERRFNYARLAVALLVVLALLLGGQWAIRRQYVESPVYDELMALPNVEAVSFANKNKPRVVFITPQREGHIYREYQAVAEVLRAYAGGRDYEVSFVSEVTPVLQELQEDLQPALYQALARHEYVGLRDYLTARAELVGCEAQLFIDEERLYLQLAGGDGFCYCLIPRA